VFAARTDARLFHVLWFRKFPLVERTLLNGYLRLLRKRLVFTAHNVDDQARDGRRGGLADRLSLRFHYGIVDHVFVHTLSMKRELVEAFDVAEHKVTVVPFGLNDVIPASSATRSIAKQKLGFDSEQRILLFFGNIAPYKGLEDLVRALADLVREDGRFTLVIAGRVKDGSCQPYWEEIEKLIEQLGLSKHVRKEIRYIPDEDVGLLFRASDVSVLPYRRVYQSGVLALSYAQGVPVIAADVGSLRQDVREGETGLIFRSGDVVDLDAKIRMYFASDLFAELETRTRGISEYGAERFSWKANATQAYRIYESLTARRLTG
jgi:D-inositol-3-phosphate glycosyltransferase